MRTNRLLDPPATRFRTALLVAFALSLAMSGTALAKGPGRPGGKSCTPVAPTALVDNNWAWSESGSWGYPGQQLAYFINVINYDVGCAAGTFVIDVHAPTGFQVTVPTNTISLKASTNGYLWAYVTSPTTVASGDYPLTVTVARAGASPSASATSYYKVYTADLVAPTLFWANPGEGQVLDGRSVSIAVSSKDDHAVSRIELDVDGDLLRRPLAITSRISATCTRAGRPRPGNTLPRSGHTTGWAIPARTVSRLQSGVEPAPQAAVHRRQLRVDPQGRSRCDQGPRRCVR